ncbi:MAG: hypothetical protein IPJ65_41495 [Archangiaceae bacterium]|nr:hypothetical protein [Archangiaceae bacterium]
MTALELELKRRWPQAPLDAAMLAQCERENPPPVSAELYLARAAVRGEAWAAGVLERQVFEPIGRQLARKFGYDEAADALQRVRVQLLTGPQAGLHGYAGRGPLKGWVAVIAVRQLLAQRTARLASLSEIDAAGRAASGAELELHLLKARYSAVFKESMQRAIESLERRQRLLLRMHTVDGLSAEKIGAIFHAHRATVFEWLAEARRVLHQRVADEVQRAAGIDPRELDSIARLLHRHTDFSLPRLLGAAPERR